MSDFLYHPTAQLILLAIGIGVGLAIMVDIIGRVIGWFKKKEKIEPTRRILNIQFDNTTISQKVLKKIVRLVYNNDRVKLYKFNDDVIPESEMRKARETMRLEMVKRYTPPKEPVLKKATKKNK